MRFTLIIIAFSLLSASCTPNDSPFKNTYIDSLAVGQSKRIKIEFALQRKALTFSVILYQQEIIEEEIDGEVLRGVKTTDTLENKIKVLVPVSSEPKAIEIVQGLENKTPHELVTNGFIKITNELSDSKQIIVITPSNPPKDFRTYFRLIDGNISKSFCCPSSILNERARN